jgi:hypothetical protein
MMRGGTYRSLSGAVTCVQYRERRLLQDQA